jgi:hypothetical protein
MATASPFVWGSQGRKISSPEQAARQRLIAEALMASGMSPAQNIGQGLADVTGALTGSILNNEVSAAEEAGALEASGLFQGLGSSSPEADIIAALSNPWASDAQSSVAQALLGQQFQDYDQDLSGAGGTEETFFGNAVPRLNTQTNKIELGQLSNLGNWRPLPGGDMYETAPTTKQIDTPTEVITTDIYGTELYRTPKDIRGAEIAKATGAAEGAAIAGAPGDIATGEMALDLIGQIEEDPMLPWATGMSARLGGNQVFGDRFGFQKLVDQATSGAFLTAIQEMRGMGSLSNAEGQTATQAITRLNTGLESPDFKKALDDYKRVVQKGVDRARRKVRVDDAGNESPMATSANPNAVVVDGFTIEAID